MSQIVEHTETDEHLEEITKNLMVEHLFYTIFIATHTNTWEFFYCFNSQTCSTIRDTRLALSEWKGRWNLWPNWRPCGPFYGLFILTLLIPIPMISLAGHDVYHMFDLTFLGLFDVCQCFYFHWVFSLSSSVSSKTGTGGVIPVGYAGIYQH